MGYRLNFRINSWKCFSYDMTVWVANSTVKLHLILDMKNSFTTNADRNLDFFLKIWRVTPYNRLVVCNLSETETKQEQKYRWLQTHILGWWAFFSPIFLPSIELYFWCCACLGESSAKNGYLLYFCLQLNYTFGVVHGRHKLMTFTYSWRV